MSCSEFRHILTHTPICVRAVMTAFMFIFMTRWEDAMTWDEESYCCFSMTPHLTSSTDGYSLKIVFISQINIFVNINTILEPLHEIEVLGAVGNNLPDFCSDIHPQTEVDVKTAVNIGIVSVCTQYLLLHYHISILSIFLPRSSLPQIRCKHNEVAVSLNEVLGHLFPEWLHRKYSILYNYT